MTIKVKLVLVSMVMFMSSFSFAQNGAKSYDRVSAERLSVVLQSQKVEAFMLESSGHTTGVSYYYSSRTSEVAFYKLNYQRLNNENTIEKCSAVVGLSTEPLEVVSIDSVECSSDSKAQKIIF